MHPSQYKHMEKIIGRYLPQGKKLEVLDFGSAASPGQGQTHRSLFGGYEHTYVGVDVRENEFVDRVMPKPYTIPFRADSFDAVVSGSVFEHVPFFWASMLEIARVLRPGGVLFITAPSRGHKHTGVDCWRYYPDGFRAMAAASHLILREVHTHYPPFTENKRHDYSKIDAKNHYWGDTVGVFEKPENYPIEMRLIRPVVRWWANRASLRGPLGDTPGPHSRCNL